MTFSKIFLGKVANFCNHVNPLSLTQYASVSVHALLLYCASLSVLIAVLHRSFTSAPHSLTFALSFSIFFLLLFFFFSLYNFHFYAPVFLYSEVQTFSFLFLFFFSFSFFCFSSLFPFCLTVSSFNV